MIESNRMKIDDLVAMKHQLEGTRQLRRGSTVSRITVHMGTCGIASGAQEVMDALIGEVSKSGRSDILVNRSGCIGLCNEEPLVTVEVLGKEPIIYKQVDKKKMGKIFKAHILSGQIEASLVLARGQAVNEEERPFKSDLEGIIPHVSDLKFFALQQSWILRNKGLIDPGRIEDYIWRDGYQAAAKALLRMSPQRILSEVKASGLRDRDGRGFPTGIEWEFCAASKSDMKYVLCNADEADSDGFVGRILLETDPHAVIEGMIIAARAINSHHGYICCHPGNSLALKNLTTAIDQAGEHGLLGKNILMSGFDFDIEVYQDGDASVCHEETPVTGSAEVPEGAPKSRLPFAPPSSRWNGPLILSNVETYANISQIIRLGGENYAKTGTASSTGTKVFCLAGKVRNVGLVEVPMGIPLGEIIFDIGGGIPRGKKFKAVHLGGLSGGYIPPELLNTPIDYDAISNIGATMGSGSLVVIDDNSCMVDVARQLIGFCQDKSSGGQSPSHLMARQMQEALRRICTGKGRRGDIELLKNLAQEIEDTAPGETYPLPASPILSTVRYFRSEYEAHIVEKRCPAAVCSALFSSPCQHACPVGMDVPAYVALIRAGRIDDAYKILKRTNPFPRVCGRVCGHTCQIKCRRGQVDEPVAIMHLKRFVTDHAKRPEVKSLPVTRKERVAIVGAGPSGLTAGLELKKRGYRVTVFEELSEAGGFLRWGIPAYRLPRNELDRDIQELLQTGIDLRVGTCIGRDIRFVSLIEDFDIIYLAVGAQKSTPLDIPGEHAEGVFGAVEFLRNYHGGKEIKMGKRVAVIGGGNDTIDAARTSIRLGAKQVTIYYPYERKDAPAQESEIKAAEDEGVQMKCLVAPVRIVPQYGKVVRIELTQMRLDKFDRLGRKQPRPIMGAEFMEKVDTVIVAVGRSPDLGFLSKEAGIEIDQGTVRVDKYLRTTNTKVWAGGDILAGPATVIDAIQAGKRAAGNIDASIRSAKGEKPWVAPEEEAIDIPFEVDEPTRQPQTPMPEISLSVRRKSFREITLGYTPEMALAEACRCMRCDQTLSRGRFDTPEVKRHRR